MKREEWEGGFDTKVLTRGINIKPVGECMACLGG